MLERAEIACLNPFDPSPANPDTDINELVTQASDCILQRGDVDALKAIMTQHPILLSNKMLRTMIEVSNHKKGIAFLLWVQQENPEGCDAEVRSAYDAYVESAKRETPIRLLLDLRNQIEAHLQTMSDKNNLSFQILSHMKDTRIEVLAPDRQLDLFFTLNTMFKIVKASKDDHTLKNKLCEFLLLREKVLQNDCHDYSSSLTVANYTCAKVVDLLFPNNTSPLSLLLTNARTANRPEPWKDYETLSNDLPIHPGSFFRDENDRIHLYRGILTDAMSQLRLGYTETKDILRGNDRYKNEPVALSKESISIIKKRSKTFKELIEYIETLETRAKDCDGLLERFRRLRAALLRGDANHNGEEMSAGEEANIEIANFAAWWNDLEKIKDGPEIKERIKQISNSSLGNVINTILDTEVNPVNRDNPRYCIAGKGQTLESILSYPKTIEDFQKIDSNILWRAEESVLSEWSENIQNELQVTTPEIDAGKNVFAGLVSNDNFMANCLKDRSIDYHTLFVHANDSILWFRRDQDDGTVSSLYETIEREKNEDFILYLLTYHASQFSEKSLGNSLKLLCRQRRFHLAKELLDRIPYDLQSIKHEILEAEMLNAEPNYVLLRFIKETSTNVVIDTAHLIANALAQQKFKLATNILNELPFGFDNQESVQRIFVLLQDAENHSRNRDFFTDLIIKYPQLLQDQGALDFLAKNIFVQMPIKLVNFIFANTSALNAKLFGGVSIFLLLIKNNRDDDARKVIPAMIDGIDEVQLAASLLHLCRKENFSYAKQVLIAKPNLNWTVGEENGRDYALNFIEPLRDQYSETYNNAMALWRNKVHTRLEGVRTITPLHYVLQHENSDSALIDLFINNPHFRDVLAMPDNHLVKIALERKHYQVIEKIISDHYDMVETGVWLETLDKLISINETNVSSKILQKIKENHTALSADHVQILRHLFATEIKQHNNFELFQLVCVPQVINAWTEPSLQQLDTMNSAFSAHLIQHHIGDMSKTMLVNYISHLLHTNQIKRALEIMQVRTDVFKDENSSKTGCHLFLASIKKPVFDSDLLLALVNALTHEAAVSCIIVASKVNLSTTLKLIRNYHGTFTLEDLSYMLTIVLRAGDKEFANQLLLNRADDTFALLATELNKNTPHLGLIHLLTKQLPTITDEQFEQILLLIKADHQRLLAFFLDYDQSLRSENKSLFSNEQLRLLSACAKALNYEPLERAHLDLNAIESMCSELESELDHLPDLTENIEANIERNNKLEVLTRFGEENQVSLSNNSNISRKGIDALTELLLELENLHTRVANNIQSTNLTLFSANGLDELSHKALDLKRFLYEEITAAKETIVNGDDYNYSQLHDLCERNANLQTQISQCIEEGDAKIAENLSRNIR